MKRTAFTLIEALVVIAIIATLMGLLLPAALKVRSAADRTRCGANLKQVALGISMYHDAVGRFPRNTDAPNYSPFTAILPYLEQDALALRYDKSRPPDDPVNLPVTRQPLPTYSCPAMRLPEILPASGWASYVVCSGSRHAWAHINEAVFGRHDGVFAPGQTVTAEMVTDGLSNTFLVGEAGFQMLNYRDGAGRLIGGSTVWSVGYAAHSYASAYVPLNTKVWVPPSDPTWRERSGWAAFRSDHPSGANFAFGDGSVRFLTESVNRSGGAGYKALASRAGAEVTEETP
jgi:prepilin-type processing-associated H-X9-DG protein